MGKYTQFEDGYDPVHWDQITLPTSNSAKLVTGRCGMSGILVKTDGINSVIIDAFNGPSSSGLLKTLKKMRVSGGANIWALGFSPGIYMSTGIYVRMATTPGGEAAFQVLFNTGGTST